MPARIELSPGALIVRIVGADRFWALKSELEIPLGNVLNAHLASDEARERFHGLRLGGTSIPGVLSAGRFYSHGELTFWDVHDPDKAIEIDLRHEHYRRLVVEVDHPAEDVARIVNAIVPSLAA